MRIGKRMSAMTWPRILDKTEMVLNLDKARKAWVLVDAGLHPAGILVLEEGGGGWR